MKLVIDLERCIMAGECVYNHPDLFEFGNDDFPVVLQSHIDDDDARRGADQAISVCPGGAIALIED